jgi:hypothetical protein
MTRLFKNRSNKAQAAIEVAVFGAVIIFLIGAIIRTAVTNSYSQNANLKAMRYALLKSWESSKAISPSRTNASVMYIEDRLSVDASKYGALDRNPFVAQAGGMFSNLLYYPLDPEDFRTGLPLMDFFINGVHIPMTTAAVRTIPLNPPASYNDWYPKSGDASNPASGVPDPMHRGSFHYKGWNFLCAEGKKETSPGVWQEGYWGCPLFYTLVANGTDGFCAENCSSSATNVLTTDERFDLNRNDNFSDDPKMGGAGRIPRKKIAWQWAAVNGVKYNTDESGINKIIIDGENGNYPSFDVDNDRKEEVIYASYPQTSIDNPNIAFNPSAQGHGGEIIIRSVLVMDYQSGDLDFTHDDSSADQSAVGLLPETAVYTMPREFRTGTQGRGTYLEVKEGKLVNPNNQTIVRSLSRRDQIDVIERRIRLSNDTGHFCCLSSGKDAHGDACKPNQIVVWQGETNPVEACTVESNGCLSAANIARTCFDQKTKILYVRSRLINSGGHKWLTDTSGTGEKAKWGELKI